jgi:hypothetical protein
MRYLKRFNESIDLESQLRDFSETYLAYLLDDGYKIQVSPTNLKTQFMIKLYKITEINEEEYESNEFTWLDVKDSYIPFLHMLNREYDIIDDVVEFYDGGDDELLEVDVEKVLSGDVLPHGRDNESILEILVWINFDNVNLAPASSKIAANLASSILSFSAGDIFLDKISFLIARPVLISSSLDLKILSNNKIMI